LRMLAAMPTITRLRQSTARPTIAGCHPWGIAVRL